MTAHHVDWKLHEFPIVIAAFPPRVSNEGMVGFIDRWRGLLDREERFVVISDARSLSDTLTALQRKMMADFYEEEEARLTKYVLALGAVITSDVNRASAHRIGWVKPPPFPREEFDSLGAALRWAHELLAKG